MKIVASNRRARFDYEISDTIVAGLVLLGSEVKSIKNGDMSLKGSYISFIDDELWLISSYVSPYKPASVPHVPERERKLLVHKSERDRIISARNQGKQIFPLAVGVQRGLVKLEAGIGTARRKHDKREHIKKRESKREISRRLKG